MKCLLIGTYTFPSGMAASARIRNLAYGFRNAGADVYIYSLAPGAGNPEDAENWISLDDNIFYHHYLNELDAHKWKKLAENPFYLVKLQLFSFGKLKRIIADKEFDLIYVYGRGFLSFAPFFNYFKKRKVPIVFDVCELPAIYKNFIELLVHPLRLNSVLGEVLLAKKSSLITCISSAIQKKFPADKSYLLPGIENWELEMNTNYDNQAVFTFLYLGIFIEKDNPALMFDFFEQIKNLQYNFIVKFAGKYNGYEASRLEVEKFKKLLGDKLILVGELTDQQLKNELQSSNAIMLLRQDNLSEENSFPTRLVEYLKSGKMVVTSPKGDLKMYLSHMKDAFLLPYTITEDTLTEMKQLIDDKSLAAEIGEQGFLTGKKKFNRDIHANNIIKRLIKSFS